MKHYVGVIGFGGEGYWQARHAEQSDVLELVGVSDISEKRKDFAAEKNIKFYESDEALIADPKIDLVIIATPNDSHKSLAIAAMAAGKHVICEKPVAMSSEELAQMTEASKRYGKLFTVYQNRRWDGDFLTAKKILDENMLGEVYRVESRVHGSRGIPGDWRQLPEYGGGMILDWGVHLLDQILMLKGQTKLSYVYASVSHITNQLVDDGFTALLTFEDGMEFLVEVGTSNFISLPRWYIVGQNGTAFIRDWKSGAEIVCASGTDEYDVVPVHTASGITKTMAPRREENIHKTEIPVVESSIYDFYRNVAAAIDGTEEPAVKLPEVMRVMKLMEAVKQSADTHEIIRFE